MNGDTNEVRRLWLAAAASIAAHQAQSAVVERDERPVRVLALLGLGAVTAAFWRVPKRAPDIGARRKWFSAAPPALPAVKEPYMFFMMR